MPANLPPQYLEAERHYREAKSTRKPIPGMMPFENVQIQLVDVPPINFEIGEAWLSPMVRNADALIIMVDLNGDPLAQMEEVLADWRGFE